MLIVSRPNGATKITFKEICDNIQALRCLEKCMKVAQRMYVSREIIQIHFSIFPKD